VETIVMVRTLLLAGAAALAVPVSAQALTYSYWYLGAIATTPYAGWSTGETKTFQTGVLHVDTTIYGQPHGTTYSRFNWSENNWGHDDPPSGISIQFDFGLYSDFLSLSFDSSGNIASWSAGNIVEGPSYFADFYDAGSNFGHRWVQHEGPFDYSILFEAPAGTWFSSYTAYQAALEQRRSWSPEPDPFSPAPIPLPAAAWLLLGGLAAIGALGRRRLIQGEAEETA
jgi:hypothetical protein